MRLQENNSRDNCHFISVTMNALYEHEEKEKKNCKRDN